MRLEVRDISFGYGSENNVLDGVSFNINSGEILSLLGPNGTGKTTLLKCINHIIKPQMGTVLVEGEDIGIVSPARRARLIGYVPQYNSQVFPIRVIDAVMMGRTAFMGNKIRKQDRDIAFDIIERMELQRFAFKNVNEISGGERQRVYIARALAQEPRVIVLDEPTSSLDMKNQLFTLEIIEEIAREKNLAVLMSIHDLNLAAMFSHNVLVLKNARVFALGSPQMVITEENVRAVYGVNASVDNTKEYVYTRLKREKQRL